MDIELYTTYQELKEKMTEIEELRKEFAIEKLEELRSILNELSSVGFYIYDDENPGFAISKLYYDEHNKQLICELKEQKQKGLVENGYK